MPLGAYATYELETRPTFIMIFVTWYRHTMYSSLYEVLSLSDKLGLFMSVLQSTVPRQRPHEHLQSHPARNREYPVSEED